MFLSKECTVASSDDTSYHMYMYMYIIYCYYFYCPVIIYWKDILLLLLLPVIIYRKNIIHKTISV